MIANGFDCQKAFRERRCHLSFCRKFTMEYIKCWSVVRLNSNGKIFTQIKIIHTVQLWFKTLVSKLFESICQKLETFHINIFYPRQNKFNNTLTTLTTFTSDKLDFWFAGKHDILVMFAMAHRVQPKRNMAKVEMNGMTPILTQYKIWNVNFNMKYSQKTERFSKRAVAVRTHSIVNLVERKFDGRCQRGRENDATINIFRW